MTNRFNSTRSPFPFLPEQRTNAPTPYYWWRTNDDDWRTNNDYDYDYGTNNSYNDEDNTFDNSGLVVFAFVVFCLAVGAIVRAACKSSANQNQTTSSSGTQHNARVAARQEASRRRTEEQTPSNLIKNLSPEDRMDFVSNVLKTEKYEAPEIGTTSSRNFDDEEDGHSHENCAICLEHFEEGDAVCSSHNLSCKHSFHRECIYEWLLKNDACPVCRRDYLSFESVRDTPKRAQVPTAPQESVRDIESGNPTVPDPSSTNQGGAEPDIVVDAGV